MIADSGEGATRASLLADVSMTSLADLFNSDDSVLAVALRRVVGSVEESAQAISGWSSFVDSPDEPSDG
jgi:FXSXX-COOH protein